MFVKEIQRELQNRIIPFWEKLADLKYGGFYGYMDCDLNLDVTAEKGCILNSRILWFFSQASIVLKDKSLLLYAKHAFDFLTENFLDKENGGLYWSVNYDGTVKDDFKHSYNNAFGIYALCAYYEATENKNALDIAKELFFITEEKCKDKYGYLEQFDRNFLPIENSELSENSVIAKKTMNTTLHILEAYTDLFRMTSNANVRQALVDLLNLFYEKIYNKSKHRLEVFFDDKMNSIIDLHSYGHDIESAWLLNRALDVLDIPELSKKILPVINDLESTTLKLNPAKRGMSVECENGIQKNEKPWWVQCEAVTGYYNAWQKDNSKTDFLKASKQEWHYIKKYLIDRRKEGEWFWDVNENGINVNRKPVVEPWKCPYHNGRMCMEIIKRAEGKRI
ncbi:MAG: AGE family epimerase/isomerase [Treponema sp.]